jgi:hypothetical protein
MTYCYVPKYLATKQRIRAATAVSKKAMHDV